MKKHLSKERKILDATDVSWNAVLRHVFVNFLSGVTGGIVIAFVGLFISALKTDMHVAKNCIYLVLFYFIHKQFESKILNRNKYITKLGKNYIFPIPSTIGFVLGVYISSFI